MNELFASPISYAIVGLFIVALVVLIFALQQLQRGRSDIYWRQRRAAGQRGGQLFLVAVTLFGISFAMAFFSGFAAIAWDHIIGTEATPEGNPEVSVETTAELSTFNLEATIQFAVAATLTAQPTAIVRAISTPDPNVVVVPTVNPFLALASIPSHEPGLVTLNTDSAIEITAVASEITDQLTPNSAQTDFPTGTKRLYIFMEYSSIPDDILWTRTLYYEGNIVYSRSEEWPLSENGNTYVFIDADFPEGTYEFMITAGEIVMDSYQFTIVKESLFEQSSN